MSITTRWVDRDSGHGQHVEVVLELRDRLSRTLRLLSAVPREAALITPLLVWAAMPCRRRNLRSGAWSSQAGTTSSSQGVHYGSWHFAVSGSGRVPHLPPVGVRTPTECWACLKCRGRDAKHDGGQVADLRRSRGVISGCGLAPELRLDEDAPNREECCGPSHI